MMPLSENTFGKHYNPEIFLKFFSGRFEKKNTWIMRAVKKLNQTPEEKPARRKGRGCNQSFTEPRKMENRVDNSRPPKVE
jgi:hypothetical protein